MGVSVSCHAVEASKKGKFQCRMWSIPSTLCNLSTAGALDPRCMRPPGMTLSKDAAIEAYLTRFGSISDFQKRSQAASSIWCYVSGLAIVNGERCADIETEIQP